MAIPTPEPGLVISFGYLWHREHQAGQSEGRKTRPAIVLAVTKQAGEITSVVVLPVTHSPPDDLTHAVEIPPAVKNHLGLDSERSWIVVTEGNEFLWPGYDLRTVPGSDRYDYGFLPPRLFNRVRDAFVAHYRAGPKRLTPRASA